MWECYTICNFYFRRTKGEHKLLLQGKTDWEKGGRHLREESGVRSQSSRWSLASTARDCLSLCHSHCQCEWATLPPDGILPAHMMIKNRRQNLCCDLSHLWAGREPKINPLWGYSPSPSSSATSWQRGKAWRHRAMWELFLSLAGCPVGRLLS